MQINFTFSFVYTQDWVHSLLRTDRSWLLLYFDTHLVADVSDLADLADIWHTQILLCFLFLVLCLIEASHLLYLAFKLLLRFICACQEKLFHNILCDLDFLSFFNCLGFVFWHKIFFVEGPILVVLNNFISLWNVNLHFDGKFFVFSILQIGVFRDTTLVWGYLFWQVIDGLLALRPLVFWNLVKIDYVKGALVECSIVQGPGPVWSGHALRALGCLHH